MVLHFLKVKRKINESFSEELDKEKIDSLFAEMINQFNRQSDNCMDVMIVKIMNSEQAMRVKDMFKKEWADEQVYIDVLSNLGNGITTYSNFFTNKTKSIIFTKKIFLYQYSQMYEQFIYVIQQCFHSRNIFKEIQPKLFERDKDHMKERKNNKQFITQKESFYGLLLRDFKLLQEFLSKLQTFIPKSNTVIIIKRNYLRV